ncbi:MAG: 2-dehydropantoate 2-reductase [Pseudomonadota bacterium]|nr:2-dehydropantoate 2-reductase [Pseudomonadota bacterium]
MNFSPKKICIYGAGAIGGYLGIQLIKTESNVSLIARGPHLDAMKKNGLTLKIGGIEKNISIKCTDKPNELGPQDYVIIAMKAHSVENILDEISPLLGPDTTIVTAQNGILWWYFYKLKCPWENHRLKSTDPKGNIWNTLDPKRTIGCVVYPSCEIVEPGIIQHIEGNRFMLGEPDGNKSNRVVELSKIMQDAGFKAPVRKNIRKDIWLKLLGNATFNPVSVITGETLQEMGTNPKTRSLIYKMMHEAKNVANKLGIEFPISIDQRINGGAAVGQHKTSMLQDFEAGRSLELDALVTSVSELGRLVNVETPTIDSILNLVKSKIS